jgi:hypothetical protein
MNERSFSCQCYVVTKVICFIFKKKIRLSLGVLFEYVALGLLAHSQSDLRQI